jgi:hypothetical protein
MTEGLPEGEHWADEGGQLPPRRSRAWFLREVANAGPAQLDDLWRTAVEQLGEDDASRVWQEALSASDASET